MRRKRVQRPKPGTVAHTVWAILDVQRKMTGEIDRAGCFAITDDMDLNRETVKNSIFRYRQHHGIEE